MRLKLDLHVHSYHSRDALNRFEEINERCRNLGFDGYALCDHDSINGIEEAKRKASGLIIIPGLEISAKDAHILCYNPSNLIPPKLTINDTVDRIHDHGGTAVIAHPLGFPRSMLTINKIENAGFDAVEVANSAQFPFGLLTSYHKSMARKLDLPQTGGSDSHIPETIGRAYTIVEAESRDPDTIIEALKSGRTEVYGSGISLIERLNSIWRKRFNNL